MDSNATVGPPFAMANEFTAPPPAQPPSAQTTASATAIFVARLAARQVRITDMDASLIGGHSDIVKMR
jgi:hypothetical protein